MAATRVFFVDDEKLLLESLEVFFAAADDFEVMGSATSGEEALERFKSGVPNLVMVDLNMAGMGGIKLITELKRLYPEVRVLVLSTYYDDYNITSAVAEGADGYILKSLGSNEIIRAARTIASGNAVLDRKVMTVLHVHTKKSVTQKYAETAFGQQFPSQYKQLTEHEKSVCSLVQQGKSNREIAAALHISEGTVKNYLSGIYDTLGVRDRTALALALTKSGI